MSILGTIATGTKILGGLSSIFGKKPDVMQQSRNNLIGQVRGAMVASDESGLHPLAILGGGGGGGYSPVQGNAAAGAQQIGDALDQHQANKSGQSADAKNKDLIDAQIAEVRSRTLLNNANSKRLISGTAHNPTGVTGGLETVPRNPTIRGNPDDVIIDPNRNIPLFHKVRLPDGKTATMPNPEAFEVGVGELIVGGAAALPQFAAKRLKQLNSLPKNTASRFRVTPKYSKPKDKPKKQTKRKYQKRPIQHY